MIFSSFKFMFVFFPSVFLVYYALVKVRLEPLSKVWLVLASFYFYAQGSKEFFVYFLGTVCFNYLIGTLVQEYKEYKNVKTALMVFGVLENVALLGYFKYTNFFIKNVNALTGNDFQLRNIVLPIGISFFTFQLIAYIVDCYRDEASGYSFLDYLLFITFFPQLIVGPIVHHAEIVPQLKLPTQPKFNKNNFMFAVFIFSIGCGKKVLIADPLTTFAQPYFNNIADGGFWESWCSAVCYTFSYYFDLSGYADMAIGLGLFFNIKIPQNFNSPYKAADFQEYWRRWHMTLSRFLNEYVFRSVYKKGQNSAKYYFAVMVTFLVSGAWHGAGWNFIVWGIINGLFVCIANFLRRKKLMPPYPVAWVFMFAGVVGTRVLFVSPSLTDAISVYKNLFDFNAFDGQTFFQIAKDGVKYVIFNIYPFLVFVVGAFITFGARNTAQLTEDFEPRLRHALFSALILVVSVFQMSGVTMFLYFQF